jgi:Na+-driven multidrug efflux pump
MAHILETGAWIAAIAVLPLTVIGWFFASKKKRIINKSQSRDGIALSGVRTGYNSPVSVVNLTASRDDN